MPIDLKVLSGQLLKTVFSHGDAKSVVECAHAMLGLPILCFDPSFHLLASAFQRPCPNPEWELMAEAGQISYERASAFLTGLDAIIRARGRSLHYAGPAGFGYSQAYCALISGSRLVGYVGILLDAGMEKEFALAACELLGTVLPKVLDRQSAACAFLKGYESEMAYLMLCENVSALRRSKISRACPPGFVIAVLASDTDNRASLEYVSSVLCKNSFPILSHISEDGLLYLFIWGVASRHMASRVFTDMENMSAQYGLSCGISDVFWDIRHLPERRTQATCLRSVEKALHPARRIFAFTEDYIDLMFFKAMENIGISASVPEAIRQLHGEDTRNHTDYLRTLDVYFKNLRKLGVTAAELGIHKNTVLNRLNRVQEITGSDIRNDSDARNLWSGLYMFHVLQDAGILDAEPHRYGKTV